MAAYEYVIQCKPTARHSNADALSRLPLPSGAQDTKTPVPPETVLLIEHLQSSLVTATQIKKETTKDPVLSRILQFVQTSWPSSCPNEETKPYWQRKMEFSMQDGCLLWGKRVIVPPTLREAVLSLLHGGHPGIVRMKSLVCMFIWWPGLDQKIEELVRSCITCQSHRGSPPSAPLQPWIWPSLPWSRLHMDYAGSFMGHLFLVIMDAHSKWIEAYPMPSTTSTATIEKLRVLFAQFGLPNMIVTDNAANFTSVEFQEFCKLNGIRHITSFPYHPASNGLAERAL